MRCGGSSIAAARARLTPEVLSVLTEAGTIFVAPSNPVAGIATILAVPGIRKLLGQRQAPVVVISPVLAGRARAPGVAVKACGAMGIFLEPQDRFRANLSTLHASHEP